MILTKYCKVNGKEYKDYNSEEERKKKKKESKEFNIEDFVKVEKDDEI